MGTLRATWSNRSRTFNVAIEDWGQARALVDRILSADGPPALLELVQDDTGRALGVGLGRDKTVITYQDSLDPPYFVSLGNRNATTSVWYWYGDEETEYAPWNVVDSEVILPTLEAFVTTAGRPETVDWEQL